MQSVVVVYIDHVLVLYLKQAGRSIIKCAAPLFDSRPVPLTDRHVFGFISALVVRPTGPSPYLFAGQLPVEAINSVRARGRCLQVR